MSWIIKVFLYYIRIIMYVNTLIIFERLATFIQSYLILSQSLPYIIEYTITTEIQLRKFHLISKFTPIRTFHLHLLTTITYHSFHSQIYSKNTKLKRNSNIIKVSVTCGIPFCVIIMLSRTHQNFFDIE